MIAKEKKNLAYELLDHPRIFNLFLKLFGERNNIKKIIKDEFNIRNKDKILDIGCGTGDLSLMFSTENYIGIDLNKNYIDFARKRYNKNFKAMDALDLEFDSNYFDLVFAGGLLHHFPDGTTSRLLKEIKRVIKSTGRVLIFEATYLQNDNNPFKKFMRSKDRGKYIREYTCLQKIILADFRIEKICIKKGIWGDNSVFILVK